MNKALMISIQPQHAVNILNGKKTLELRSWIPKDYVGWVYVYVTKGVGKSKYHHLYNLTKYNNGKTLFSITNHNKYSLVPDGFLNGKVAFRFWFDEYEKLLYVKDRFYERSYELSYEQQRNLCLTDEQIHIYGKGKDLYAWHIKQLDVFDEPKQLSEFYKRIDGLDEDGRFMLDNLKDGEYVTIPELRKKYLLSKAPQKFCYCYVVEG